MNVKSRIASIRKKVDRSLDQWLPKESDRPSSLHRAMRYSIFSGGKRLRPVLTMAAAEVCGGRPANALPAACAVECVHTYSLIHDDLPCMDNDDLRRGRPTSHKVFGEAIAVLAGDALLTIAFEMLAKTKEPARHNLSDFYLELAIASGSSCLIGGQVADIEAENKPITPGDLRFIHRGKTAALISASLKLGAMSANATPKQVDALATFGSSIGLAFQIIDDILDVTQSTKTLGKSAGKDSTAGKATYPAVYGIEKSKREAARLTKNARKALEPHGSKGSFLLSLADHLLDRKC